MEDDSQVSIGCAHSREGGISGPPRSLPPPPSFLQILPPWSVPTEAIHRGAEGNASSSDTSSPAAYCPSSCATALPIDQSRLLKRFLFPISFPLFFLGRLPPPSPDFCFPKNPSKGKDPLNAAGSQAQRGFQTCVVAAAHGEENPGQFGHPSQGK